MNKVVDDCDQNVNWPHFRALAVARKKIFRNLGGHQDQRGAVDSNKKIYFVRISGNPSKTSHSSSRNSVNPSENASYVAFVVHSFIIYLYARNYRKKRRRKKKYAVNAVKLHINLNNKIGRTKCAFSVK